ncbi:Glutathione-regulated potassium-efflux system ancillary protein kefF [Serratia fonticola]|uniref:Glutathione-regulated potassium-efflux system ancillary protein kefF n=1 Tax=Serratia fonticola TaxID=47917 RepID=A0A448S7D0_SERFO|nr:Glutathione-regulated potassium-efflux system ancillary protein kefF [Serratia fonticola]CAI0754063.1 Glutathione-regulated potassium-efflux system ancillary protein kefF [Serratia fonticola]CAI1561071.1 Glutathione-regulated potassium-efflux system ancillary protein kefF [Serratia fonticola]CAI1600860.1 Glutathione-regulated potassium-efflux system ancillary protein kefF [Serratia fonticola]CAI1721830.1 Glutathione-regulated potassium-efflux system ancillary protein kefF [Serratia fonticola
MGQPLQATAIYCGMKWQPYFAVHNTFTCNEPALIAAGEAYRQRLVQYLMEHSEPATEQEPSPRRCWAVTPA